MNPRTWYRFENQADDPSVVDIHIIDWIGDWIDDWFARNFGVDMGVTARQFVADLAALPDAVKTIRVHINSPGGDVFAAVNIANALRDQQTSKGRTVETIVDGLAASAASIIMMAGKTVSIADNALVMVHDPWTIAVGNAKELGKVVDELNKVRDTIVATYRWHSSLVEKDLVALMAATTWMDADEAIENGFATAKIEGLKAAAAIDARALAKLPVPDRFKDRIAAFVKPAEAKPAAASATEVLKACKAANCLEVADELLEAGATMAQVTARVESTKTAKAEAAQRETTIRQLCDKAKQPELADGYIRGAMAVADVKAHLAVLTAKFDAAEIDGTLKPDAQARSAAVLNVTEIYRQRNALPTHKE